LLNVYRRTRGDLDQAISERDALKVHLAKANDALATQKKVVVQREIIIPAPVRQTSESTPTAPRIQAVPKIPAKAPAAVPLEEPENIQEEPALSVGAQALESMASEPVASIQQEQVIAMSDETASDESWLVHSSEPSRAIFGNALASRMRRITSGLD